MRRAMVPGFSPKNADVILVFSVLPEERGIFPFSAVFFFHSLFCLPCDDIEKGRRRVREKLVFQILLIILMPVYNFFYVDGKIAVCYTL